MRLFSISFSVCLLVACAGAETPEQLAPGSAHEALTAQNGSTLNGSTLNGSTLNGTTLSGMLVSVLFSGATLQDGTTLDHVELRGTRFWGYNGLSVYTGADFLQAGFTGVTGDGSALPLRVADMSTGTGSNADLDLYDVQYLASNGTWQPACYDPYTGAPTQAIPVAGHWDYRQGVSGGGAKINDSTTFTFACLGGAIAKCVLWGYRPWATYNGVSLAPYHQACTRLVRADYCGDGMSHTQNGNRIDLYDRLGIQQDTENWFFEANWDVNGARCIHVLNRNALVMPCISLRLNALCGLLPDSGALLSSETPTLGLTQ